MQPAATTSAEARSERRMGPVATIICARGNAETEQLFPRAPNSLRRRSAAA